MLIFVESNGSCQKPTSQMTLKLIKHISDNLLSLTEQNKLRHPFREGWGQTKPCGTAGETIHPDIMNWSINKIMSER